MNKNRPTKVKENQLILRILFVPFTLVFISAAISQPNQKIPNDILAKFGSDIVTTGDLLNRLETMPLPGKINAINFDTVKARALHTLIAERLLASKAREMGIGADSSTNRTLMALEKILIANVFYRRAVLERVNVSEEEIEQRINRIPVVLRVVAYLVRSESDGERLAAQMKKYTSTTMMLGVDRSLVKQSDTITIGFASAVPAFEEAAYSMDESRISAPFFSDEFGWTVLSLVEKRANPDASGLTYGERRRTVEQILKDRQEQTLARKYYHAIVMSKHAVVDTTLFNLLAATISDVWKPEMKWYRREGRCRLTSDQIGTVSSLLRGDLTKPFITTDQDPVALGEIIELLRYGNFVTPAPEGPRFRMDLNEAMKTAAARVLLAREGEKRQLYDKEVVRNEMRIWSDNWRAEELLRMVGDTVKVADDEIVQYLIRNGEEFGNRYEVSIVEILCPSSRELSMAMKELQNGTSFNEVAAQYTTREEWLHNGGKSGYFPVSRHSDIGFSALMADVGKVVGPLRVTEGYSLFKVVGKRKKSDVGIGFDTLAHNVRAWLQKENRQQAVNRYIADLARAGQLKIDYKALQKIGIGSLPALTRLSIGHDNSRSNAVLIMQEWEWIGEFFRPTYIRP